MKSDLEYPLNFLEEAVNYFEGETLSSKFPKGITDEQINGVLYVINRLQCRYRDLIFRRYRDKMEMVEIAGAMKVTVARLHQLLHLAFNDVYTKSNYYYIMDGVSEIQLNGVGTIPLRDIGITQRTANALGRADMFTVGDLLKYLDKKGFESFMALRGIGQNSYIEIKDALRSVDIMLQY